MEILSWNVKLLKIVGLAAINSCVYKIIPFVVLGSQLMMIPPLIFYILFFSANADEVVRSFS